MVDGFDKTIPLVLLLIVGFLCDLTKCAVYWPRSFYVGSLQILVRSVLSGFSRLTDVVPPRNRCIRVETPSSVTLRARTPPPSGTDD